MLRTATIALIAAMLTLTACGEKSPNQEKGSVPSRQSSSGDAAVDKAFGGMDSSSVKRESKSQ